MSTHSIQPLISCLCVTRNRPEYLARTIRCFLSQTYQNRELIVIYPEADERTAQCLRVFESPQIRSYGINRPGATLGELRNFSIECARGDYVCGWDDDDWHNPQRLQRQFAALASSKKGACVLARMFIYDSLHQKAYLSCERLWENSVMFDKAEAGQLGIRYPHLNTREDYGLVHALIEKNLLYPVNDPTSYIYHITGANTCEASHFHYMLKRSTILSDQQSAVVREAIEQALAPLDAYERMESKEFKSAITYVRPSTLPRY